MVATATEDEIPPPKPTLPAGAMAIDRLVQSVENMRAEMAAQGALSNRERTTVLDHLARFDQALKTVVHDLQLVKSSVINALERIEKLEAIALQKAKLVIAHPPKKIKKAARRRG